MTAAAPRDAPGADSGGRAFVVGGLAAVAAYAVVLALRASHAAGGADSSGYLNAARAFAAGRVTEAIPTLARLGLDPRFEPAFRPLGYVPSGRPGVAAFYYPPGLPAHFAAAAVVAGWKEGPFLVAPLCAAAAIVLLFLFARDLGVSRSGAAAGSAILAVHPAFVFQALQPMSDVPATAWSTATLLAARRGRADSRWAAAAGAAFGAVFLVRPASVLLLPALVAFLGFSPRRLAALAAGGALPLALFVLYNRAAFGGPLSTGYVRGGLLDAVSWGNFAPRARHYGHWLSATLTGLVLLGWIVSLVDRRIALRDRAGLFLWFAAFFLFYCFYTPYDTWWYLRFLLPAFPALIVGFLVAGEHALAALRTMSSVAVARAVAAAAVGIVLALEVRQIRRLRVMPILADQATYPDGSAWAAARIPAGALVVSMQMSGALKYYTKLEPLRWDAPAELPGPVLAAADRRAIPVFALLFPFEREPALKLPGVWDAMGSEHGVALYRRAAAPGVFGGASR